ncbi:rhomboid family intramembrane serine protease [Aureibaculum sp. 2210JD6-5]|uniref:rhomboid family intramembrane serine protease n=1 Tax=Aureibaculum sp. 2210JD6-5 TaxID=3103957 RepID=UPI002AAE044C|nr:rhomboid family intramembrane serine protease [Aureibaculum sp. 2210JD6-5]MDY7394411.1 rhomboid family intramembrane serine protease [Aureibaculum sp. 2210JD6-5]
MDLKEEHTQFKFSPMVIAIPLYFVLFLWIVFWVEGNYNLYFTKYGLYPQTLKGLRGIIFSPFIHSGVKHLFNNSIPLFILMTALFYFYREIAFKVLIYGVLLSGLLTWIIARPSYHIGASGIVYLLFSFILFSGMIRKYYRLIAVSLIVIFLYGSMIWYVLPIKDGISWEGHLSGFLVGILFSIIYRKHGPQPLKYEWEEESLEENGDFFIYDEDYEEE